MANSLVRGKIQDQFSANQKTLHKSLIKLRHRHGIFLVQP